MDTTCIPSDRQLVYQMDTQDRLELGKVSIGKDRLDKDRLDSSKHPTLEEVKAYCNERGNRVDPERFVDYYTANGWRVGKNPMKDWRAAVRTWEREAKSKNTLRNYKETGDAHAKLSDIKFDMNEL